MLQEKEYEKVINELDNCFRLLKCRLFVDQWLLESTRILFALVNKTENPTQMLLFENLHLEDYPVNYSVEVCDLNDYKEYTLAIDNYMKLKYCTEENVKKKELREFKLLGCEISIWCICLSPCFDKNIGKFLLEQAFQTITESLTDWCIKLETLKWNSEKEELQELPVTNWHDFVQGVLQKTYQKVNEQLESFYSPVKIPYIISLSGEYYEKMENNSNLLFLPQISDDDINISCLKYDFRNEGHHQSNIPFVPENIRRIRKVTQMTQGTLYLILQIRTGEKEYEVLGICEKKSINSLIKGQFTDVPYFTCRARGHMKWDLLIGEQYIFSFINGDYRITSKMPKEYLKKRCENIFPLKEINLEEIYNNICEAQNQPHGTMLVILLKTDAKNESLKFYERRVGMKDAHPDIRTDLLNNLDSIDGSILMDTYGRVHSIGVILDGVRNVIGRPERGARYNSALKYCKYLSLNNVPGLILIVSEDGSIDMIDTNTTISSLTAS